MSDLELFVSGVDFAEGPRWHDGQLWYSDFYQHAVFAVSAGGDRRVVHEMADRPSGLGWLPDGSLLVVSMEDKKVLREEDGQLVVHADLSAVASGRVNDMVVDERGNAYVGNFGFDLEAGESFAPADLALVRPDGTVEVAATDLRFPNGSVITPDGRTLIVGESFGGGYEAFTIDEDGTLSKRRRWADVPGSAPDGCSLDAEGAIWFADAIGQRLVRVKEGGEVAQVIDTPMPVFACVLGGDDGTMLLACCAPGSNPDQAAGKAAGAIWTTTVDVPHAGRP